MPEMTGFRSANIENASGSRLWSPEEMRCLRPLFPDF
jgi:hypothetical protein